jgi:hypothetical protein
MKNFSLPHIQAQHEQAVDRANEIRERNTEAIGQVPNIRFLSWSELEEERLAALKRDRIEEEIRMHPAL